MAQKVLPYEYEVEDGKSGLTSFGGLPTYLDLASATGLLGSIDKHLKIHKGNQGWTDRQIVLSLIALNLAGGDCVDDIEKLEADEGCRGPGLFPSRDQVYSPLFSVLDYKTRPVDLSIFTFCL